jgi:hypothetical protein
LERRHLKYLVNRAAVDQRTGPVVACDWIEFGTTHWNNDPKCAITVCQAKGTQVASVVVANGWAFEKSLSARHTFVDRDELQKSFDFVRSEPNIDVYRHRITGEELRFPQQFRLTGRARSCRLRQVRNRSRELAQSGWCKQSRGNDESIESYSAEYGQPQEFSVQQVRTAFEHWGRFQAILADKGKQNLLGVKFEATVD